MKKHFESITKTITFALLLLAFACTKNSEVSKTLRLAIWPSYISDEIVKNFEKETGIHVEVSNFSTNEELYAKLKAGGNVYDLVVPSDYMVQIMASEGLLEELGSSFDSVKSNIDKTFLGRSYDSANKYAIPYAWTTTGIALNKEMVKDSVSSWKALLSNKALAGKVALLDDGREVIGAALKSRGLSLNTTSDADLKTAKAILKQARSQVKLFTSEPYLALSNKEIAAAQIYSSDALQLIRDGKLKIDFVMPEEGASMAIDNFALPKGTKNKDLAEKFVSYVLAPAQYKINVESRLFGPVVKGLAAALPANLKDSQVLFPKADRVSKLEQMKDLGSKSEEFDRIWTEFKAE
ncbi:MAG: spermidine/putrescine ABC transporter substrate-binding protein [bacterium]